MNITSINNYNLSRQTQNKSQKPVSFKGGGLIGASATIANWIDTQGLWASFTVQDMLGTNLPRSVAGYNRNRNITGEPNYAAMTEVVIREFVTGPSMFLIPMIMAGVTKKFSPTAGSVKLSEIKQYGEHLQDYLKTNINSIQYKKSIPDDFFKSVLEKTFTVNGNSKDINFLMKDLSALSKTKTELRKIPFSNFKERNKIKASIKSLQADSNQKLISLIKHENKEQGICSEVKIKSPEKFKNTEFDTIARSKFVSGISDYMSDIGDKFNKAVNRVPNTELASYLKRLNNVAYGGRATLITSMLVGLTAFCLYIPTLYTRHEENPGLKGLVSKGKGG